MWHYSTSINSYHMLLKKIQCPSWKAIIGQSYLYIPAHFELSNIPLRKGKVSIIPCTKHDNIPYSKWPLELFNRHGDHKAAHLNSKRKPSVACYCSNKKKYEQFTIERKYAALFGDYNCLYWLPWRLL